MAVWPGKDPGFQTVGDDVVYTVKSQSPCKKTTISCSAREPRARLQRAIKIANNQLKKNMTRHIKGCKLCSGDS